MRFSSVFYISIALFLGACGGTSMPGGGGTINPPSQVILPVGTATYQGFTAINVSIESSTTAMNGNLQLDVDFSGNGGSCTGTAENFRLSNSEVLSGRLFVTGGVITQSNEPDTLTFNAGISGTVIGASLPNTIITGQLIASTGIVSHDLLAGTLIGDVTRHSATGTFTGSFSTAKQ